MTSEAQKKLKKRRKLDPHEEIAASRAWDKEIAENVTADEVTNDQELAKALDDEIELTDNYMATPPPENAYSAYKIINDEARFTDFQPTRVRTAVHRAFIGAQRIYKHRLPPEPAIFRDIEHHPLREQFLKAIDKHIDSHKQIETFQEVNKKHAAGQKVLSSIWVFKYKTDKHGFLQKCKACLVICGNQQAYGELPTQATTLASTSFRILMIITAKFDLETIQIDVINAFVHCDLDKVVYMKYPPGIQPPNRHTILRLKKALYGLRRSPLLWQKDLTSTFRDLGFIEVPQEPYIMIKGGIIVFFFVDDIVIYYRQHDKQEIDKLQKPPSTPLEQELALSTEEASPESRHLYQQKIGSILFAAITTRPDIALASSKLSQFNQNPSNEHHRAVDRVIQYLYGTRGYAIQYGSTTEARSFICASDTSFADDKLDRKSSQGFVMILFGGLITWRANKQNTVTTSTTEAELLALSQTAKEGIFIDRLLKGLTLQLNEPLLVYCDNL
ncbi:hypothetical protein DV736_g6692, partial [Chaetothyriales sp. CBS 134916]